MKTALIFPLCVVAFSWAMAAQVLRADDWKTTDGKTYQNVVVVKTEPDAVTITHKDGGALVPLSTLPPDLQKKFNYDPATAKAAAAARAQADAKNAAALQAEMNQANLKRQLLLISEDPRTFLPDTAPSTSNDSTPKTTATSVAAGSAQAPESGPVIVHHSTSDIVDVTSRLKDDHASPNRNSMAFLLHDTRNDLMPDPNDPKHHSTDDLLNGTSLNKPSP